MIDLLPSALALGLTATAFHDLLNWGQERTLGIPAPRYAPVGRWIAGIARGRLRHQDIRQSPPATGEAAIGITAHYAIGVIFAAALLLVAGSDWLTRPTPVPALLTGFLTVAFPFFVMQPAFGFGIAAARTPAPWSARRRSLWNHLSFGICLYLAGLCLSPFTA
ncbi:DUF2938 domain-containing protein [Pseudooceanicola sp. C21-150M6]|uniref:DUF2938 domain-containing protein n=1 Tax=Pseudooceanicola sp. C21-150M6 TaxID=3434355 RepID=UPI003D7F74B0